MKLSVSIQINATPQEVWKVITDFENCQNVITNILGIEVLEKPQNTLIGFKWKETRIVFGKEASEIMWITDAKENEFYKTRAESHGAIYISKLTLKQVGDMTELTMSFSGQAQTFIAKIMSKLMAPMMKKSLQKEMMKDLEDIKNHIEGK